MNRSFDGDVVFVTGASGGLGTEFVLQALGRGADRVYAASRAPVRGDDPKVVPVQLDITSDASVEAATATAADTTIVINSAGIAALEPITSVDFDAIHSMFETNFFGALRVARSFAPVLAANGGGTLLNVVSVGAWYHRGGAYAASKAALWSATNALRLELVPSRTTVIGLYMGFTRTTMTEGLPGDMNEPADIVRIALDGIRDGRHEILADQITRDIHGRLSEPVEAMYAELHK
ncbi:SDR family oxidoreductase [Arthrobacter sp. MSA 4-2]|uniref:SDR family oxidoreductase n=1 Tax=Arthrobacter sp. MSA 4-2 TaxID=2794349 RepID=UPI0018E7A4B8|nr:SDR family oxidoreductase [Arthrobacter sp. MSA 4-2]MBJ2121451.1 SDR family oxidoreductase [Arthrobacter sp. MSA 4-2]